MSIAPQFVGDAQKQKHPDDLRQARESEVQIRERKFLVSGILCGYGRKKREDDRGVHRPVYGQQEEAGKRKQPLLAAACDSDAMTNPQYPFQGSASSDPSGGCANH